MSKYDKMVENDNEVHAYLERMVEHARQKGIMITMVSVNAPIIDRGCDCVTPYGQKHPELIIESCKNIQIRLISDRLGIKVDEDDIDEFDC